jgi:hypothetical protein
MNPNMHHSINPRVFSRKSFLQLLEASLESGSFRFARQAALNWLAVFPGDLTIQLYLGKAHLAEGKLAQALPVVERVCRFDPEYTDAQETLSNIYRKIEPEKFFLSQAAAAILTEASLSSVYPEWVGWHLAARKAMESGNLQEADHFLHQVMSVEPDFALAAIDHLNFGWKQRDRATLYKLAEIYHNHWPECLQFALRLAEVEIEFGNETSAVGLLHQCVANDATGHAAQRLWGLDHRYQPLWTGGLEIFLDLPVPSEVAFQLGWNRLPAGEMVPPTQPDDTVSNAETPEVGDSTPPPSMDTPTPDSIPTSNEPEVDQDVTIKAVEETFSRLAKKMKSPSLGRADGRYPVYVIFSSVKGLDNQYGPQTRDILIKEMQSLADYVAQRPGWNTMVFLPDQPDCAEKWGIKPVDVLDPWKLKLSLSDLDQALAKKGQMIGALLIVGGAEIVPFHRLPNPTSDVDQDVPSDNPYATLDSNYFVPEWPVGRLPGEAGKDAGFLLEQLRFLNQYHAKKAKISPQLGNLIRWLIEFLRQLSAVKQLKGIGYTASVWKEASALVLKSMNENAELLVSPPNLTQTIDTDQLVKSPLEYFNLHGLSDAPEWYGQKDSSDTSNDPDYPIALSPKNLAKNGNAPQIVFTEACYGAHVFDKCEDQSIALKFLSIGSHAFVGSTTIAYGSVTAPLIGADLLGFHFWKYLREGSTVGEALLQGKLAVAKEMNQRQGFLDGEDQKTLISFVLYGDPLSGYEAFNTRSKSILRFKTHPSVKTICDRQTEEGETAVISQEVLKEVRAIVEAYLPGLDDADFSVSAMHEECDGKDHDCPTAELGVKTGKNGKSGGVVVTVSKSVQVAKRTFHQYARVTLNEKGKMIKLAVSR